MTHIEYDDQQEVDITAFFDKKGLSLNREYQLDFSDPKRVAEINEVEPGHPYCYYHNKLRENNNPNRLKFLEVTIIWKVTGFDSEGQLPEDPKDDCDWSKFKVTTLDDGSNFEEIFTKDQSKNRKKMAELKAEMDKIDAEIKTLEDKGVALRENISSF